MPLYEMSYRYNITVENKQAETLFPSNLDIKTFLYLSESDADLVDIGALGIGGGEPDCFEVVSLRAVDGADDIVCIGIYVGDGGGFVGLVVVEFDEIAFVEVGDDLCSDSE